MTTYSRREMLVGTGALMGSALLARPARAADATDLTEWLAKTDGADTVVDATGRDEVVVEVGTAGNGGDFGFSPAVVRVSPETTVTWKWTGKGGSHNVVAEDGTFESEYYSDAGATFAQTVSTSDVIPYACAPHSAMGMRGALVVGDVEVTLPGGTGASGEAGASASDGSTGESESDETSADASAQSFDGWLAGTGNYDGIEDHRGESEVTIEVGATGNGGEFAFEPAAIHIDPGTVVRWEWVGTAGAYDVMDEQVGYASDQLRGTGHEYALAFDGDGLSKYECTKYGDKGMRGVVLVGDGPVDVLTPQGVGVAAGTVGLATAGAVLGVGLHLRTMSEYDPERDDN
ncbi:halocyanin domain-containing protein [Halogeometricum borinquense]|uniref:Halocyanin domain-containing protein n=1 Tax=Halogeometricum borinquense TaxID=60847 RepID=A0A482T7T9_9EURY|nr:halocyanin domain-containing protein [Halogeometricum borinquense]RYJ12877.1 halocyanin domain-containing protein [Halogeometricum borinquense]